MSLLEYFCANNAIATGAERSAVRAFDELLAKPGWRPANPYLGGFIKVIEVGLLCNLLSGVENAEPLLLEVAQGIAAGTGAPESVLSELHVGALLGRLNCPMKFVLRSPDARTPDLVCELENGGFVEVEVVRAHEKQGHILHKKRLEDFALTIGVDADKSYAIFINARLTDEFMLRIVDAVCTVNVGETRSEAGAWSVTVGHSEEGESYVDGRIFSPDWWPSGPSFNVVSRNLCGTNATTTYIETKVPIEVYREPIRRKAERFQGSGKHPFIVALDASDFLGAHQRIPLELAEMLPEWPHISAVLLQYPFFAVGSQEWRCSLLRNQSATMSVPEKFLKGLDEVVRKVAV